jgi:protein-disulfide isomerase
MPRSLFRRVALPALTAIALVLGAPAQQAQALDLNAMSDAERAAFRAEVRAYLMENPEVIIEAVNALEARNQAAQAEAEKDVIAANAEAIFNDGRSWVGGNPQGDVTLVEFMDYRCGYCRKAVPEVEALLETDGNIRLVIKEYPILGDDSVIMSRFAIATRLVAGDAAYKDVHDAMMALNGAVSPAVLTRLGDGLGLDSAAILARMDAPEVTRELSENRALAQMLGIGGTPTFVLEDEILRGYMPAADMATLVATKRD